MSPLTPQTIAEFWQLCNAAYECWVSHRALFDDNTDLDHLGRSHCAAFLAHLSIVTQRDTLHQIVKLHDPPGHIGQHNLSIAYITEYGLWDRETRMRLNGLKTRLDSFASLLREARNKITAHNDLTTRLLRPALGRLPDGADIEYFKGLQECVDIVVGTPQPFNMQIRNDARVFVESLVRGARA